MCQEANNTDNNGADINITFPEIDFSMVHFSKNLEMETLLKVFKSQSHVKRKELEQEIHDS